MKALMVMFDSLNRRMLPPYGCDWVHAPSFDRLSRRAVTFDTAYVGSMPCMPARRELHTGRCNFLHRSWGPLEPFDDSMPEILRGRGVHTHLVSDHQHYWEDGGATYHHRYQTWDIVRGQEGDRWKADLSDEAINRDSLNNRHRPAEWAKQDWVNRAFMKRQQDLPQHRVFEGGLEFLERNGRRDNWFLQIETFDPHEPFFVPESFQALYEDPYRGPHYDWPPYGKVTEVDDTVRHIRVLNAALVSMCDHYLGLVLDAMDRLDLWKDTLLVVNTDHGYLLGEHDWWAKCIQPFYEEVARMPLFIWDPRAGAAGVRRASLVQTIDLAPTVLEAFGIAPPPDMQGRSLAPVIASDAPAREAALFGLHGGHVNVTDGRHVYMRAPVPANRPLFEYTLMPTHMRSRFAPEALADLSLAEPFGFTKGCRTIKVPGRAWPGTGAFETLLFDLASDPAQDRPLDLRQPAAQAVERRMIAHLQRLMRENDAPAEQWERLGLA
jgi:arylsulfatase A-like enzyme